MALGTTETRVQLDVIWETLRLALIGIALGMMASLAVARLIASLLFQTAPTDPLTFVGVVVLLGTVALLAGFLPARRASTIDPRVALRKLKSDRARFSATVYEYRFVLSLTLLTWQQIGE